MADKTKQTKTNQQEDKATKHEIVHNCIALKRMLYGNKTYEKGQAVDVLDKDFALLMKHRLVKLDEINNKTVEKLED